MLTNLSVQNFALIENANLSFEKGFTVITGETGSGKSILLGALALILGERANYAVIRDDAKKTIVEAEFDISSYKLKRFFKQHDLDFAEDCLIRREIHSSGKSRAFINDTPVPLVVLKALSEKLVHINSQHNTLALKEKTFQLDLLDTLAGLNKLKEDVRNQFFDWKKDEKSLKDLKADLSEKLTKSEFQQFQINELEKLDLEKYNYEELSAELERAENAETLIKDFTAISELISSEEGMLSSINTVIRNISNTNDDKLNVLIDRLKTVGIELDDIGQEADSELENVEIDPQRLDFLIEKVDVFNAQLKKLNFSTQEELKSYFEELAGATSSTEELQQEIENLEKTIAAKYDALISDATDLSNQRIEKSKTIATQIEKNLDAVKLTDSKVIFDLENTAVTETGIDKLNLLFTPNKGLAPQAIEKSASGGELSRFMLVIQSLLSKKKSLPTLIFDEIDTGVSGDVADRMGSVLKSMGEKMQIFAITHLPQVASKGQNHIKVSKSDKSGNTITDLELLSPKDRITEVAKLMSGKEVNEAAIANAKKLIEG